jgi:hypothetical protein
MLKPTKNTLVECSPLRSRLDLPKPKQNNLPSETLPSFVSQGSDRTDSGSRLVTAFCPRHWATGNPLGCASSRKKRVPFFVKMNRRGDALPFKQQPK